ncbi:hypothetical protein B5K11_09635 [Rhizobium leguminosarum bv. trifolii]|nr:hypothetical protein B5K11_09635 [Rhizobium leguminosarum bv. trifolii]
MFGAAPVTRESLISMQPHVRTECLALIREHGASEADIARMFGLSRPAVQQIVGARHQYNLPTAAESWSAPDHTPHTKRARGDISDNALTLLRRVALYRHGWTAGKVTIARETDISEGAAETAIAHLLGAELIVRLQEPGRGRPSCYSITPKGAEMLASLSEEA